MSILSRFQRPARPTYATKIIAPEETKADPITPLPEPPAIESVQRCAACGKPGAINNLTISYFGYITLPFVYLCDDCESTRIEGKQRHYTDLHRRPIAEKETVEVSALEQKVARKVMRAKAEQA